MSDQTDPALSADRQAASRSSAPRVRLSCDACRQRKVKCDKLSPCTSCQRLGYQCVPVERARLPRGRTRRAPERANVADKELADRVAKLEQLLKKVSSERDNNSTMNEEEILSSLPTGTENSTEHNFQTKMDDVANWRDENAQPTVTLPPRPQPYTSYMASTFWEDIMQRTQELRSVLDERVENETPDYKSLSGLGSSLVSSESPQSAAMSASPQSVKGITVPAHTRRSLCEIYINNVEPMFKLLHKPSLRAFLIEDKPYLDYEPDHPAPNALALAVYYGAVCTIDDSQCQLLFGTDKKTIAVDLHREVEAALNRLDFVVTDDLVVLQALVISLIASRSRDQSRRVWMMLSMALRIAQALCLHIPEPPFQVKPFDREMRRRCWQCIGLLDVVTSLDRASEPMMQNAWLEHAQPSNINDEDMWVGMEGPIEQHPEGTYTDTTHLLVLLESHNVARTIAFGDFSEPNVQCMALRQQVVSDFQKKVCKLLSGQDPAFSAFQRLSENMALVINGWIQLSCLRPIKRTRNFVPPPVQGDVLLRLAADNLQMLMEIHLNPEFAPWRWCTALWVPWHALAVALAELCVCKDPAAMAKYWPIVEKVFHESTYLMISDSQHMMLWRPLKKLMAQARARNRELLGSGSPSIPLRQTSHSTPSPPVPVRNLPIESSLQHLTFSAKPPSAYPMDLAISMAAGQPMHHNLAMAPPSFSFDSYPNVWDAMDFENVGIDVQGNNAWLNYDSFVGDVYDSVDSTFLPQ